VVLAHDECRKNRRFAMTSSIQKDERNALNMSELTPRLRTLRDTLRQDLIERDDAVRLALLAALAGEHLLLVGPPGTAKSLVARRLHLAFADTTYFERLLTRFSVPEELFGPLSIKALEEDRYQRQTAGYLPTAAIAFLDEIFKANSAILNALLTLLNEREFDNGVERQKTPIITVIGASNELNESEELDALYDRFLLRLYVGPVGEKGFEALLDLRGEPKPTVDPLLRLTTEIIEAVRAASELVVLAPEVRTLLLDLRKFCLAAEIQVSDRRWRKIVKLLQTSAVTNGRTEVSIWDCWLLQHCLWNEPEQRIKIYEFYAERVGASRVMDPRALVRVVARLEAQLERDQTDQSQTRDEYGRLLFEDEDGEQTTDSKGLRRGRRGDLKLFLAPDPAFNRDRRHYTDQPVDRTNGGNGYTEEELGDLYVERLGGYTGYYSLFKEWSEKATYLASKHSWHKVQGKNRASMEPRRHKAVYIDQQAGELQRLLVEVDAYRENFQRHLANLEHTVTTHLWLDPTFLEPATAKLIQSGQKADDLAARVLALIQGVSALPIERDPLEIEDFDVDFEDLDMDLDDQGEAA
jgi:MoxR-like ATPase